METESRQLGHSLSKVALANSSQHICLNSNEFTKAATLVYSGTRFDCSKISCKRFFSALLTQLTAESSYIKKEMVYNNFFFISQSFSNLSNSNCVVVFAHGRNLFHKIWFRFTESNGSHFPFSLRL